MSESIHCRDQAAIKKSTSRFSFIIMDAESDRGLAVSVLIDIDRDNTKKNIEALSTKNVPRNP